jgi:hypothetical protein
VRHHAESRQLLRRVPNLHHLARLKAYSIGRKNLAAAVLYDAAEPGLKQSPWGRQSTDGNFRRMPQDLTNRVVPVPQNERSSL